MPTQSPKCDPRSLPDLVRETEALATAYSKYVPRTADSPDMGFALIRVFAKMAAAAIDRLNRVPERSFLAYLDMLGEQPGPARQAKVPLKFQLVPTGTASPLIPAGTRIGAQAMPGDKAEVVFETTEDLATTRSVLRSVLVHDPKGDRFADVTKQALGIPARVYSAFSGDTPLEHSLLIPASEVLSLPKGSLLSVRLRVADPARWLELSTKPTGAPTIEWSASDGDGAVFTPLPGLTLASEGDTLVLSFRAPGPTAPISINGRLGQFIRARSRAFAAGELPAISGVTLKATMETPGRPPEAAFGNDIPLDLGKDVLPFGERPRWNDTFYLGSKEVLSCPGAVVTLDISMSDAFAADAKDKPTLAWEVFAGGAWRELGRSTKEKVSGAGFTDTTLAMSVKPGGKVTFTLPADVTSVAVRGIVTSWLRVRLIDGNYGRGLVLSGTAPSDEGFRPPCLKSVKLSANLSLDVAKVLTRDDFVWTERSLAAPLPPFSPSPEARPALYLGFDAPFQERTATLYLQVAALSAEALLDESTDAGAEVVWEYLSPAGWVSLSASDGTKGLTRSGIVSFIGPRDLQSARLFAQERYWLRGRWASGSFAALPRVGQIATNTIWAQHVAGGSQGNRKPNTITLLKTTIPYVDKVTNHEPATGGADPADHDDLLARGPRTLRHSYRAVAAEDFEDLAMEASAAVARARALTPDFDPIAQASTPGGVGTAGKVGVLIIAQGDEKMPSPSAGLITDVQAYLEARSSPTVALRVSGPEWIQVTVALRVVPKSALGADALRNAILTALDRYLHPLSGQGGQGWDFGHVPAKSDFYPVLAGVAGLGYIHSLNLTFTRPGDLSVEGATAPVGPVFDPVRAPDVLPRVIIFSGPHTVEILAPQEA